MLVNASKRYFDWKAEDFKLISVNEQYYSLKSLAGKKGTVVVFICNHCPYVIAIAERLSFEAKELKKLEVNTIAIMSNDVENYPEDSFENMKKFSKENNFTFPYLYDETQEVAKAFGAVCTPDFFGYNKSLELQYRGRLDNAGISGEALKDKELLNAFRQIIKTGNGPEEQKPSMGCSIKWK